METPNLSTSTLNEERFEEITAIALGDKVRDKITGFTGIVTAGLASLYSTPQMEVASPQLNDRGEPVTRWFPELQLTFVSREG